jgi:hypothetical protein
MRNGLVYVLMNHRKHSRAGCSSLKGFDVCSSAWWLDGWVRPPSSGPPLRAEAPPVMPPETWLAREGWKLHGLLRLEESPRVGAPR